MPRRRRHFLVTGLTLWALVGCDPSSTAPLDARPVDGDPPADAGGEADSGLDGALDMAPSDLDAAPDPLDGALPDIAGPDGTSPDRGLPDGAAGDTALTDAAAPDMASPDVAAPDMALPDPDAAVDMRIDAGPPPLDPPQITEVAARDGAGVVDEDDEPSDWLELYNPNPVPYLLADHHLTDDRDDPFGWALPPVDIPPRGYRVVFASGKDRAPLDGPLHTDFRLSAEGEYLALTDPDGAVLDAWDGWPPQIEAATWGRPMTVERRPLDAPARAVPLADAAPGWTGPVFADGPWPLVALPLGVDRADPDAPIATPLDAPGAALRLRVEVPPNPGHLEVSLRFADGVAVWLDGVPVFAYGMPAPLDAAGLPTDAPAADARATVERAPVEASAPLRIALDAAPGPRVIALAGLDGPADDGRFMLGVEAADVRRTIEPERRYLTPTPGADNSPPVDLGPIVSALTRDPPAAPDTPLEVVARVHPTAAPIASVRLTWRVAFEPPEVIELAPDPDDPSLYRATLPAAVMLPGQMIRWFVEAADTDGRTTREPPFADPTDSEEYRGTVVADPTIASDLPVLHWFMERPELADRASGGRASIWFDGELYDNVRFDLHGQSTRGFPKKSYDVDLNRDHRFRLSDDLGRMKDFNLLTTYADKSRVRNTLAYGALASIGADHHLAFPMRVQRNRSFFAVADFVEDGDDRWIERLGYDPVGPLYKVYDGAYDPGRAEKKTRREEDNADYAALIAGLGLPPAERRAFLYDNVDLARMANYLAGNALHATVDCCHKNYYLYRDAARLEWWMMTWDVDLSFGRVWTGNYFDDRMYPENGLFLGRDTGSRNQLLLALYDDPAFVEMYLRRTRSVLDAMLQPPGTPPEALILEARVDALTAQIGDDARLDAERWPTWGEPQTMLEAARRLKDDFLAPRRAWVYGALVQHEPGVILIPPEPGAALGRYRVPLVDDPEQAWTAPDFDDADWIEAPLGLGYENAPADYDGFIATVVRPTDLDPAATGIQLRVPFVVDDPAAVDTLTLSLRYDDGVVAWLNGVEVARRNVEGLPAWDAGAVNHPDNQAVSFEGIDISAALPALRPGLNVLAIHVVNTNPGSSDLLIQPALVDGALGEGVLPPAQAPDAIVHAIDMQAPDDPAEAWIAVENPEPVAVDVSDWLVRGAGIEHRFTPGTVIPAGGTLYVVADSVRFRARAESPTGGEGLFVQGDWRGQLVPAFGLPDVIRPDGAVIAPGGL